ncbi:MAG: alpha-L-rhamnosidase N-terminal domain-containing protein, partial [Planctomycetota bacterium]
MLFVNGRQAGKAKGWQTVQMLDITEQLATAHVTLALAVANQGDAPNPAGLAGTLLIEFEAGDPMTVLIDRSWKASAVEQTGWQEPDFEDQTWSGAKESARVGDKPWGQPARQELVLPPPPYLRKGFVVNKPVERATVYASALGLYELHVNGKRVGKDYFTPGWTDYTKRV